MVIHDLRNPTTQINFTVDFILQLINQPKALTLKKRETIL
jgi:hypothetical protein